MSKRKPIIRRSYYIIDKRTMEFNAYIDMRTELMNVEPWYDETTKFKPKPFSIFKLGKIDKNKVYLPRQYGCNKFGIPDDVIVSSGAKMSSKKKYNIKLRKHQRPACKAIIESYNSRDLGGIIVLPPASGKTYISLVASRAIGRKTLIIVGKRNIAQQWKESISTLCGTKSSIIISEIKRKKTTNFYEIIKKHDYIICVSGSMISGKFNMKMLDTVGFVIIDEIHSKISEKTLKMFTIIPSRYILALTATPRRIDNLNYLYSYFIGKIIYQSQNYDNQICEAHIYRFEDKLKNIKMIKNKNNGIDYIGTYKNMMLNKERINFVVNLIKKYAVDKKMEQILVVDMLRANLESYKKLLIDIDTTILYSGSDFNKTAKVILSIYNLSKQGLDMRNCNCIILVMSLTTKKDITGEKNTTIMDQIIGRIKRKKHKNIPTIVDINHNCSFFKKHHRNRLDYYKKKNYNIIYY